MRDADFRTWWAAHQVRPAPAREDLPPAAGRLALDVQQFTVDTHPDQLLIACTAQDEASKDGLRFLLLSAQAKGTPLESGAPSSHL
ncbi:hypothetical protein SK803_08080 [Lentzea sp. BCCO 10_0856]|uniref:MmyB-like transcription regulator ligand binding domain-containing protein n=1 Tax=Lentzea miocenica TaxID=3095431 RepID=A0ABU4SW95_9PSEU|nr:hypothetical protein [Lentzea sp. BCCO 10_0856]MDX8030165.1 hypothetical protein [Lentzea sp. BCCO 10_0856]